METETDTMEENKYLEGMAKYLSGNISVPEKAELLAWVEERPSNRAFFEEMIQLWSLSGESELPFEADIEAAWKKLDRRIEGEENHSIEPGKVVRLQGWKFLLRVAAVLLVAITAYWWYRSPLHVQNAWVEVRTAESETRLAELPDGSRIWLNENTVLGYDQRFRKRQVRLTGEAFFEVERMEERPFVIRSNNDATITVLGTSFNVRAYPGETRIEVTVETGKVALTEKEKETNRIVLEAGTSGFFDKDSRQVKQSEQVIANADSWKTRVLRFDDTSLQDVFQSLERYFDIEIAVADPAILNCLWTVTYENPELDSILEQLAFAMNLEVTRRDSTYVWKGEGCQ